MRIGIEISDFKLLDVEIPAKNRIVKSNITEGTVREGLAILPEVKITITCNNHVDIDKVRHLLSKIMNE